MAVHTGSPKQGQWGQQGQTPISHTRTRDITRWENHLSPAFPQDYIRPEPSEKKRTNRENNRKHRPHQTQTFHQIRSIGKCGRQGNISPHLSSLYRYTHACVRKKRGCPHCPRVPVNSLQSAKGSEEITPHGREVIFTMFKGTSRHPPQDYKNFGTRFRGSCTKFHRTPQQCAPCSYLTLFR